MVQTRRSVYESIPADSNSNNDSIQAARKLRKDRREKKLIEEQANNLTSIKKLLRPSQNQSSSNKRKKPNNRKVKSSKVLLNENEGGNDESTHKSMAGGVNNENTDIIGDDREELVQEGNKEESSNQMIMDDSVNPESNQQQQPSTSNISPSKPKSSFWSGSGVRPIPARPIVVPTSFEPVETLFFFTPGLPPVPSPQPSPFKVDSPSMNNSYSDYCSNALRSNFATNQSKIPQANTEAENLRKRNETIERVAKAVMLRIQGNVEGSENEDYFKIFDGMLADPKMRNKFPRSLVEQYYSTLQFTNSTQKDNEKQAQPQQSSFTRSAPSLFKGSLIEACMNATKVATDAAAKIMSKRTERSAPSILNANSNTGNNSNKIFSTGNEQQNGSSSLFHHHNSRQGRIQMLRDYAEADNIVTGFENGMNSDLNDHSSRYYSSSNNLDISNPINPHTQRLTEFNLNQQRLNGNSYQAHGPLNDLRGKSRMNFNGGDNLIFNQQENDEDDDRSSCGVVRNQRSLKRKRSSPYPSSSKLVPNGLSSRRSSSQNLNFNSNNNNNNGCKNLNETQSYSNLFNPQNYNSHSGSSNNLINSNPSFLNNSLGHLNRLQQQKTDDNGFSIHSASSGMINESRLNDQSLINRPNRPNLNNLKNALLLNSSSSNNNRNDGELERLKEGVLREKSELERFVEEAKNELKNEGKKKAKEKEEDEEGGLSRSYESNCIKRALEILDSVEANNGKKIAKDVHDGFYLLSCYELTCEFSSQLINQLYSQSQIQNQPQSQNNENIQFQGPSSLQESSSNSSTVINHNIKNTNV